MEADLFNASRATLSPCRKYRYELWRIWDPARKPAVFIGLNPSTADETQDDPTIRRCKSFAERFDCGGLCMINLFAFRATDPEAMKAATDPIGPDNDNHLLSCCAQAGVIVCAWGAHGSYRDREKQVCWLLKFNMKCLGRTKDGQPRHPLYLKKDTELVPYNQPSGRGWK